MKIRNKMAIALRMARKKLLSIKVSQAMFILDWSDMLFSVWANVDGIQKQWAMDSGISKNTKF